MTAVIQPLGRLTDMPGSGGRAARRAGRATLKTSMECVVAILEVGANVLVCHRRMFPEDLPRFFVGSVVACEDSVAKVTGITWTRDVSHGFHRKRDLRTKLISLRAGAVIVYELPAEIEIESLRFEQPSGHTIVLTDGEKLEMDLSERIT